MLNEKFDNFDKDKQNKIAYQVFEKREIVKKETGVNLGGDHFTDWVGAEKVLLEDEKKEIFLKRKFSELMIIDETMKSFFHKAKKLLLRSGKFVSMPCFRSQVLTACRIFELISKGKRYLKLTGPFQVGKTGVFLITAEIILAKWTSQGIFGRVIVFAIHGKKDIEGQLKTRIEQYGYTASVDSYNSDVIATRCNKGKKQVREVIDIIKESTEHDPVLIILDESHWGTEKSGLFDRTILKELSEHPESAIITVSATPFEEYFSICKDLFQEVYLPLGSGYVGPSMIYGVKFPHDDDYVEEDVGIEETISPSLKYYSGLKVESQKINELVEFLDKKGYFHNHNVSRWYNIKSADVAADKMSKLGYRVVRHYGKYLNELLVDKLPNDDKSYCLVVVDGLQCSTTLPQVIKLGIDAASFTLDDFNSTVTTIGQGLFGRLCGYGRHGAKIITCPGMKNCVNQYKTGEGQFNPHLRVKRARSKFMSRTLTVVLPERSKKDPEWKNFSKKSFSISYVEDDYFDALQACYETYKKDHRYKDKKGDPETSAVLGKIKDFKVSTFWYRKMPILKDRDEEGKTYGGTKRYEDYAGIFYDDSKNKVWGVFYYKDKDKVETPLHQTGEDSMYPNNFYEAVK